VTDRTAARLQQLLQHAVDTVPFYSALRGRALNLAQFPVIGKKRYIDNLEHLMSTGYRDFARMYEGNGEPDAHTLIGEFTSGSSGYPLTCYKTVAERTQLALSLFRKRCAVLRTFSNDRMFGFIHNTEFTAGSYVESLGNLSEENIGRVLTYLRDARRPAVLHGNTMLLERYADFIRKHQFPLGSWRIEFIESVSESMSGEQKRHIEQQFRTTVFNCYGCLECYNVAYDCRHHRLHVNENVVLEITDPDSGAEITDSGEEGEVVLTALINRAQPFIRYKTGDLGRIETGCPCGSAAPVIVLSGHRKIDYIKLLYRTDNPSLTICGYDIFATAMHRMVVAGHDCLSWYNIVQTELDRFEVLYSPKQNFPDSFFPLFTEYVAEELGMRPRLDFIRMNEQEILSINKKARVFRSLLQTD